MESREHSWDLQEKPNSCCTWAALSAATASACRAPPDGSKMESPTRALQKAPRGPHDLLHLGSATCSKHVSVPSAPGGSDTESTRRAPKKAPRGPHNLLHLGSAKCSKRVCAPSTPRRLRDGEHHEGP